MHFQRIKELVNATSTATLCAAWGMDHEGVDARKHAEIPLTIREAATLAELHGLRLEDVLAV